MFKDGNPQKKIFGPPSPPAYLYKLPWKIFLSKMNLPNKVIIAFKMSDLFVRINMYTSKEIIIGHQGARLMINWFEKITDLFPKQTRPIGLFFYF